MSTRQEYNKKILAHISEKIDQCSDMRFVQILWALRIDDGQDNFYEESKETLEKVENNLKKINNE
jgi:hypothetical protein